MIDRGKRRALLARAVLCTLLLVPVLLATSASASVPRGGVPSPWDSDEGPRPTAVTKSVECVIVEVREERTLLVRDDLGREHEIEIPEDAVIKPRRKRDFDGLRKLDFAHLRPDFRLKLTFLTRNGEIVRVKVLDVDAA